MKLLSNSAVSSHTDSSRSTYLDPGQRAYIVLAILLASFVGFLDRHIISLLIVPIRADLNLSNTQIGLLYGFAFVILFATAGLFIGRLVDRYNRRTILAVGVGIWSVATVACGLAPNFTWLFVARVLVGTGEACLAPAACSILADCFKPEYRSRALFVYSFGSFVGVGASMLIGGILFEVIERQELTIAGIGSWRLVFILVGAPGLLVSILVRLMKEPPRRGIVLGDAFEPEQLVPYLKQHRALFTSVYVALAAVIFWSNSLNAWIPSYLIRQFGLSVADVGTGMGILLATGGILGAFISVQLCDRWTLQGKPAAKFRVAALGSIVAIPAMLALPFVILPWQTWACLAILVTASTFSATTGTIMMQDLFPNRLRGQGTALMLFVVSLLGVSAGPLTVGLLIDAMGDDPSQIAKAVSFTSLPALALVVVLWLASVRKYDAVRSPIFLADARADAP